LEVIRYGLWDFDAVTGQGYLTPGFRLFLGYGEHEAEPARKAGFELVHPDDREAAETALIRHLAGFTGAYQAEVRLRKKNGQYLHVLSRGKVFARDAAGRPLRMMGVHLDIDTVSKVDDES